MMPKLIALAIDAEFTSFDMIGGDMIDFGVVEVFDDYTLGREWQGYFRPGGEKYFTEGAREVHGISYFKALTFPEKRETLLSLMHWLAPLMDDFPLAVIYFGSWNFDFKWLGETFRKTDLMTSFYKAFKHNKEDHINLMKMCKEKLKTMPRAPGETGEKGRWKLDNIGRFYDIKFKHHTALDDARTTGQIYCNIMKGEKVWTGELF